MIAIAFYATLICFIFLNKYQKRKHEIVYWTIAISILWFLCVFVNDDYVDWQSYIQIYESSITLSFTKDIGFGILCFILKSLKLPAIFLRVVIFTFGFILLTKTLTLLKVNKLIVLLFYSYYPIASDCIHLRTYIVSTILIYAVLSYFKDRKWLKYIILIVIAAMFHKMAILYLPFVVVGFLKQPKCGLKLAISVCAAIIIAIGWNKLILSQILYIFKAISERIDLGNTNNFMGSGIEIGWIIDWAIQLSYLIILFLIKKSFSITDKNYALVNYVFWINVVATLFLPLYLISFDYFRLFRNMLVINYICIAIFIQDKIFPVRLSQVSIKIFFIFIASLALVFITCYLKVTFRGRVVEEFLYFFYNNYLLCWRNPYSLKVVKL